MADYHQPIGDEMGSDEEIEIRLRKYEEYMEDNRKEMARLHAITAELERRMGEAEEEHRQLLDAHQRAKTRRAEGRRLSELDERALPNDGDIEHLQGELEWTRQRMEELQFQLAKSNAHRDARRSERSESEALIQEALDRAKEAEEKKEEAEEKKEEAEEEEETGEKKEEAGVEETGEKTEEVEEKKEEVAEIVEETAQDDTNVTADLEAEKPEVPEATVEQQHQEEEQQEQEESDSAKTEDVAVLENGTSPEDGAVNGTDEGATSTENGELTTVVQAAASEHIQQVTPADREADGNIDEVDVDQRGQQLYEVEYEDPPQRARKPSDDAIYQNVPVVGHEPEPDYDEDYGASKTTTSYMEPEPMANGAAAAKSSRVKQQMAQLRKEMAATGTKMSDADLARLAIKLSDNKAPTRTLKQIRQGNTKTRVSLFEQL